MADIATVSKDRNTSIYSDNGKTSPLSDIPTSSPSLLKSHNGKDTSNTPKTTDSQFDSIKEINRDFVNIEKEERSKSIVSDESSDLSDLDSEAETERMFNGEESQLKSLSKIGDEMNDTRDSEDDGETTLQAKHEESHDAELNNTDDQLIKNEVIDELSNNKEESEEIGEPMNDEDIGKVVEDFKKEEHVHNEELNGKRRLEDNDEGTDVEHEKEILPDSSKRQKLETDAELKEEETTDLKTGTEELGEAAPNGEDEDEAEDEDEENEGAVGGEEEEEEELLTEEQRQQKQKELELDLQKQQERKEALDFLTEIEVDFAKLRDRLYADKMERFKSELSMCLNGSHPELKTVYTKIDSHREERTKLAELEKKYKLECIARKTQAQRTQVHQQFYKQIFDAKNQQLKEITEEWYQINKERRAMDLLVPEYGYKIPEFADELIHQRQQLNSELSVLVGLNHYYGFPKAPQLKPVEGDELAADLNEMNIPL